MGSQEDNPEKLLKSLEALQKFENPGEVITIWSYLEHIL